MKNNIALYIRVSTEEQARIVDGSLVSQKKRLEEYVEGQNRREDGWGRVFDVYIDEGKSAKNMNRPEFQRMLRDIQSGQVNLVLSTELSRLSRSIKDFCSLWDFFKEHKTRFVTLREQFDTTSAAGEMMVFNLINFAQFERMQTSERLIANFTSRAQRGLWNGGQIPLGYKRNPNNPGTLLVDEDDAIAVKTIFETFLKAKNLRQTCLRLTELGVRTKAYINRKGDDKGGNHYTVASLHHLLTNATYIGLREINKKRGDTNRVTASWPAMIAESDFAQVQKVLEGNRRRFKPDEWKTYPYPLTGITTCGECGLKLNGKSAHGKTQKHHYYDHPRLLKASGVGHVHKCQVQRVKAERIEDLVARALKTILADSNIFAAGIKAYKERENKDLPNLKAQIKKANHGLKENERLIENLVNRIAELPPEVSAVPLYKRLEELQAKIKAEKETKEVLETERYRSQSADLNEMQLKARLQNAIDRLNEAPKEKTREIYANLLQFAEIHPMKIKLGVYTADENARPTSGAGNVISILSGTKNLSTVGSCTIKVGGEGEIRTHDTLTSVTAFQAVGLNHSPTSPQEWNFRSSGNLATAAGLRQA
jgi:site-specific DNA recombinase